MRNKLYLYLSFSPSPSLSSFSHSPPPLSLSLAFNDVLSHPDLSLEIGSAAVKAAIEYKQSELAFNALQLLKQTMKSPSDKQALQQLHLVRECVHY